MTTSENRTTLGEKATGAAGAPPQTPPPERRLDWRRLTSLGAALALAGSATAGLGQALGRHAALFQLGEHYGREGGVICRKGRIHGICC